MLRALIKRTAAPAMGQVRTVSMAAMNAPPSKREGDISDSFASMSGKEAVPLPDRFRELKLKLAAGREDQITAGWKRLLKVLKTENEIVARRGPSIIPEVRFSSFDADLSGKKDEIKKRGAAVIRGVIPEAEARAYKFEIEEYVRQNPHTKGSSVFVTLLALAPPVPNFDSLYAPYQLKAGIQVSPRRIHKSSNFTGPRPSSRREHTQTSSRCRPT